MERKIRGIGVRRDGDCVVVNVPDPAARLVVVRQAFVNELLQLSEAVGNAVLISPHGRGSRNLSANLAAKIVIDQDRIRLNAGRLRSTWLVAHLAAGTRMPELLAAAGVAGFGSFDDLLPFVARLDSSSSRRLLREA